MLVLASCKIQLVNACSLPYKDNATQRFLLEMVGDSKMMGRIRGTIHLVRKGDVSLLVPVSRLSAAGPNSSHSRTLATETVSILLSVMCFHIKSGTGTHVITKIAPRTKKVDSS